MLGRVGALAVVVAVALGCGGGRRTPDGHAPTSPSEPTAPADAATGTAELPSHTPRELPSLYEFDKPDLDAIHEAVFRHMIPKQKPSRKSKVSVYCLRLGPEKSDPEPEFLARFARDDVRNGSECGPVPPRDLLVELRTGQPASYFTIRRVRGLSANKADAEVVLYRAELIASGYTFTVEKVRGVWKVSNVHMDWIS